MSGVILFGTVSCKNAPTVLEPVEMFAVNQKYNEAGKGLKNLNYKLKKDEVAEWVNPEEVEFIPLNQAPELLMCMGMNDWLIKVKPTLKAGSIYFHQKNKKKKK